MSKTGELIFLHIWIILWIIMSIGFIWGNFAEKSYYSRMKWFKWITPKKWTDKKYFIKWTKRFFYFALLFGILIYLSILFGIL